MSDTPPAQIEPKLNEVQPAVQPPMPENAIMLGAFLEFLQSEKGSQLADKVVTFFDDWKKQTLSIAKHSAMWGTIAQLVTFGLVIGVALYASLNGKMDPVLAGLIGTLAGYALGKKTN